jgi:hypothetical protein
VEDYRVYYDGTVTATGVIADTAGTGFGSSPLVDSVGARLYVFTNSDPTETNALIYQLPVNFTSGTAGTSGVLGQAGTSGNIYVGAFDNLYFTSTPETTPTGDIYVCGRAAGAQTPTLYQVPITSNVLGMPVAGPTLSTGTPDCSPVTEFLNGTTDSIFLSVAALGSQSGCTGIGCIMAFNVTSASGWGAGTTASATLPEAGGTSGVTIDNSSSATGASQVYFAPLSNQACVGNGTTGSGTGGCAIQASQAGLN